MATVFLPCWAMPVAMLALVVVFPTPPFPDVITTTLDTWASLCGSIQRVFGDGAKFFATISRRTSGKAPSQRGDLALTVLQEDLHRLAPHLGGDLFGHDVRARDGDQLGLQLLTEDSRAGQPLGAGHGTAPQRRIDVHVAVRDDLGAGVDRGQHHQICLLYTSDAADDLLCVDLGGR